MKKISLVLLALGILTFTVSAQTGGGPQRRTPEERTAVLHAKLDSAFKLEPSKLAPLDTALVVLYKAQDKKREELMAGMPDRETFRAEMKKYTDAAEEMIKAVLTADQYAIWTEKILPSMRPQRPAGGGNR